MNTVTGLPVRIAGLGYYLPERVVTSVTLEKQLGIPQGWIERVAGIQERRYATSETTVGMAAAASRMALQHAGIKVSEVDAIIGAQAAPEQFIPCTAALVQRELDAPDGASACFDVNATCLSFLAGLQSAAQAVAAGVYRTVLLFSSEIRRFGLNPKERESAVLIGDAAAAAVITRAEPSETSRVWHSELKTYSSGARYTECLGGGTLHHPNDPATTPEMNMFHMDGPAVFKKMATLMGPFLDSFLEKVAWGDRRSIEAVVPHQASGFALKQLWSRFDFRPEQVVLNLATRGNCIAASIPLALSEAVHGGRIRRGDRVLIVGTGAGVSMGAMALTY
jgi:3-oxoacyl-[acyl-carrier-protein] synthase-3